MDEELRKLKHNAEIEQSYEAACLYIDALERALGIVAKPATKNVGGWHGLDQIDEFDESTMVPLYPKRGLMRAVECLLCHDCGEVKDAHGHIKDCPCGVWYPNKWPDM